MMTNGDHEGLIFSIPHSHEQLIIFLVHYLIPYFILENMKKRLPESPEYAEMRHRHAAFRFYHSLRLLRLYEIDISPTFAHVR